MLSSWIFIIFNATTQFSMEMLWHNSNNLVQKNKCILGQHFISNNSDRKNSNQIAMIMNVRVDLKQLSPFHSVRLLCHLIFSFHLALAVALFCKSYFCGYSEFNFFDPSFRFYGSYSVDIIKMWLNHSQRERGNMVIKTLKNNNNKKNWESETMQNESATFVNGDDLNWWKLKQKLHPV